MVTRNDSTSFNDFNDYKPSWSSCSYAACPKGSLSRTGLAELEGLQTGDWKHCKLNLKSIQISSLPSPADLYGFSLCSKCTATSSSSRRVFEWGDSRHPLLTGAEHQPLLLLQINCKWCMFFRADHAPEWLMPEMFSWPCGTQIRRCTLLNRHFALLLAHALYFVTKKVNIHALVGQSFRLSFQQGLLCSEAVPQLLSTFTKGSQLCLKSSSLRLEIFARLRQTSLGMSQPLAAVLQLSVAEVQALLQKPQLWECIDLGAKCSNVKASKLRHGSVSMVSGTLSLWFFMIFIWYLCTFRRFHNCLHCI